MNPIRISVILCAHNPNEKTILRVLDALENQTLTKNSWELIIVDNASAVPLDSRLWRVPRNTRWIHEPHIGLTRARNSGFNGANGEILVLVDDDNVIEGNYLESVLKLMDDHPEIGVAGGRVVGEYEYDPPKWALGYLDNLAIRDFGDKPIRALIYNHGGPWEPCGAGMAIRAVVAQTYMEYLKDSRRLKFDRVGKALSSCGDTDLARTASDMGFYMAYEPTLNLIHVIPRNRLKYTYMTKLIYNIQRDGWVLYRIRGRDCAISSWRIWLNIFKLPFLTFTPNTKAWFLSAVSLFGQIRGRSLKLVEKIHD